MGAWDFGRYRWIRGDNMGVLSENPTLDEIRVNLAIRGIQRRLKSQGFNPHREDGVFGWWTMRAVKAFQADVGLTIDGQAGEKTIGELFRQRLSNLSFYYGVPLEYGVGIVIHESGFDPAATNINTNNTMDRGWTQINDAAHPEVTDSEAFAPLSNFKWCLESLVEKWKKYKSKPDIAWQCAVASHKSPVAADQWFKTGQAPDAETGEFVYDVYLMGKAYWDKLGYWDVVIPPPQIAKRGDG